MIRHLRSAAGSWPKLPYGRVVLAEAGCLGVDESPLPRSLSRAKAAAHRLTVDAAYLLFNGLLVLVAYAVALVLRFGGEVPRQYASIRPDFGLALVNAFDSLRPDVVVADVTMPRMDGIAATTAIRRKRPDARIVLVSVHDEPELVRRGFEAGASAYVLKIAAVEALLPAIDAVLRGERQVVPAMAGLFQPGDVA